MNCLLQLYTIVLLLLSKDLGLCIEVASTEGGSLYFFYQQPEYPRDCEEVRDQCSSNITSGVYIIKPEGYPQPIEVYCDSDTSPGGWTVIQRRNDGSLTFRRSWEHYQSGFGFLSGEFWIGLDKLSYLTNQAVYALRVDILLSNGSFFYITYNSFRIGDGWSNYAVASAEGFRSNWSCVVSACPQNMTHESCTCQNVCTDSVRQTDCYANCVETCVPEGCLVPGTNSFISNGESFINTNCTQHCTCVNNRLSCNAGYECSSDATCKVEDGTGKCYCNEGFEKNGDTCIRSIFTDCYDAYQANHTTNGVYTILPTGWTKTAFAVFCDMTTAGGGWTVLQRRTDHSTNFHRDWNEYKEGFGSRDTGNDFWLGNEKIYSLTSQKGYKLRVDIVTSSGSSLYAEYTSFQIGSENTNYRLNIGSYSGNAGNGLNYNNGEQFSTRDRDNDGCRYHNFAEGHKGGWWYTGTWYYECYYRNTYCFCFQPRNRCSNIGTDSNLNGDFDGGNGENLFWVYFYHCNLNSAEMKIRPSSV